MSDATDVLEQVRSACQWVADHAVSVQIDGDRLRSYMAELPLAQLSDMVLDSQVHYTGRDDDMVAFILTLDTINFGSGFFRYLCLRPGLSGYETIAASLTDYYHAYGPLTAHQLTQLTPDACATIFGQDNSIVSIYALMQQFTRALHELGHYLLEQFDGSFLRLVEAANGSAAQLVRLLIEMPSFNDVALYRAMDVPFYKRAQIAASDLALAFYSQGPGSFTDLDRLTIFADNQVPHVLRIDGVLRYSDALATEIDFGTCIGRGSYEEIEIRACAVHAVELMVKLLREAGQQVSARELDYLLWNRGLQPLYRERKAHRTITVYY